MELGLVQDVARQDGGAVDALHLHAVEEVGEPVVELTPDDERYPGRDPRYARLPKDLFKGGLAISGIYDMRPMVQVDWLNGDLRLDEAKKAGVR